MSEENINVWGYLREYEAERDDLLDAVEQVFRSGRLILGDSVQRFEHAFASYCGLAHGVGVGNGTDALVVALEALDVGPGDEVVTVSNTAAPTIVAINTVGARARFVDIDPKTMLMDTSALAGALSERTRCILPVHLYGQCVDMSPVLELARARGVAVLEDCAQAHGATLRGARAGSFGDIAAFSFYPTKVLGAYGDGGLVATSDDALAAACRRLRYYGMAERYYVLQRGHNTRLDELQAELLNRKLTRLDAYIERRQQLAARYAERLADTELRLPVVGPERTHVYYVYVVRHPKRDAIISALRERGINLNISYPWPCHTMEGFAHFGYAKGDLPVTEAVAEQIFSLPMYPSLTDAEQDRVCDELRSVLAELQ
ncbi:DegT/DnrJ/EryC1/StrS family aminotransferase [Enhygromyxa salina]|uniref:dTDP-3-amino-3,6-dideoxy-alpha-D-galactopyranose transaminase n=1 Tax=Enhygromyxa salina TaxID=215803 RepID=A0A2S9Y659_9BACT|nr:DegT/DnrJ/EryC1/StrS family aminotransferase [Enhygromyxa salina]PRQ00491.1 dTDP-3-amino-3,6-dideoxy-alpha-D-galactopyranose transaminase [Enhygromyxa salina]